MGQIIIGHTTATTSLIWAKTEIAGKYWLALSILPFKGLLNELNDEEVTDFFNETGHPLTFIDSKLFSETNGLTNTFQITSLAANTKYYYLLASSYTIEEIDGKERIFLGNSEDDYFRTMSNNTDSFSFGFYSCNDFSKMGKNLWPYFYNELKKNNADFVIGGGDQMYADSSGEKYNIWKWLRKNKNFLIAHCTDDNGNLIVDKVVNKLIVNYRELYQEYWKDPSLQRVYKGFPQYMIWDDHEIMDGWGSLTENERAKKLCTLLGNDDLELNKQLTKCLFYSAMRVYNEFQHSHNPGQKPDFSKFDDCIWDYNFEVGKAAFYVLDMRGHHDVEAISGERLLGKKQKERFNNWLNKPEIVNSKALFIVSPVPVVHWKDNFANTFDIGIGNNPLGKDDFKDEWGHATNEVERNWLLNLVMNASHERKQKIIFLSGDVHSLSIFKITVDYKYKDACVYNLTSSGITRKPAPLLVQKSICGHNDRIKGYEGGRTYKCAGEAAKNNFALITVSLLGEELKVESEICYYNKLKDQLKAIKIELK